MSEPSRPLQDQEWWGEESERMQREIEYGQAEVQAMLNSRYGTKRMQYDAALLRDLGIKEFDAYVALDQLHAEFGDAEIDMDRARREPSVYLRVLDRVTAKRESEAL